MIKSQAIIKSVQWKFSKNTKFETTSRARLYALILTWYREDGDQEGRPVGGRLMYCTPRVAEHLHWAKSGQMGYAIFGSGSMATSGPFFATFNKN